MNISKEKIKLIATDLDGTLLNNNKEISENKRSLLAVCDMYLSCSEFCHSPLGYFMAFMANCSCCIHITQSNFF